MKRRLVTEISSRAGIFDLTASVAGLSGSSIWSAALRGFFLDELDLVAVRIFHESDHGDAVLHRACLACNLAAPLLHFLTRLVGVIDFDRNMPVTGAQVIFAGIPVVGELQYRSLSLI